MVLVCQRAISDHPDSRCDLRNQDLPLLLGHFVNGPGAVIFRASISARRLFYSQQHSSAVTSRKTVMSIHRVNTVQHLRTLHSRDAQLLGFRVDWWLCLPRASLLALLIRLVIVKLVQIESLEIFLKRPIDDAHSASILNTVRSSLGFA